MDVEALLNSAKDYKKDFKVHRKMFEIYEGNLSKHLDEFLSEQLSHNSLKFASLRKSPINIQRKIVDKLSTIYQSAVTRTIPEASTADMDLLGYYVENMNMNTTMNLGNEFFNMSRSTLLQPYVHKRAPKLRAIPNDRFFVYSDDEVDPLNVTHVVISQEEIKQDNLNVQIFHAYTDQEFFIFDSNGDIRRDLMNKIGNPEGINAYGKIPFVYVNRSSNLIMPPADLDFLHMTLLIPALMTDLNFASMFTLFSIMYGIDIDDEALELAPNAFWKFKSDPATDKAPSLGTIKNEADVLQTLELVKSQLAFWLETRSIRAGSIGDVDSSNFANGISKLIDESDTTDEKKRQIGYFKQAEKDLWELLIEHMHPVWASSNQIDNRLSFSPGAYVETEFVEPVPLFRRGAMVGDLKSEVEAGFLTKRKAIEQLNADKSKEWIDELIADLEQEQMLRVEGFSDGATEGEDQDT